MSTPDPRILSEGRISFLSAEMKRMQESPVIVQGWDRGAFIPNMIQLLNSHTALQEQLAEKDKRLNNLRDGFQKTHSAKIDLKRKNKVLTEKLDRVRHDLESGIAEGILHPKHESDAAAVWDVIRNHFLEILEDKPCSEST